MVIKSACLKAPKRYACRVLTLLGTTMLVRTKDILWLPCWAFGKELLFVKKLLIRKRDLLCSPLGKKELVMLTFAFMKI